MKRKSVLLTPHSHVKLRALADSEKRSMANYLSLLIDNEFSRLVEVKEKLQSGLQDEDEVLRLSEQ